MEGRCGAKMKKSEERFGCVMYCANKPVPGRDRCKFHGGKSPRGADHPTYKGRGWSRDIPTRLADRLAQSMADPDLTSLHAEIGLVDARIGELLAALPTGESGENWDRVKSAARLAYGHFVSDDRDKLASAFSDLLAAVEDGDSERKAWKDISTNIEQRRRLADVERKREEQQAATLTSKQALALVGALQVAIMEEVSSAEERARIGARLQWLLNLGDHKRDEHGHGPRRIPQKLPGDAPRPRKPIEIKRRAEWLDPAELCADYYPESSPSHPLNWPDGDSGAIQEADFTVLPSTDDHEVNDD